jgi:hypothetical protein
MWIFKSYYVIDKSIVLKKYELILQDVFASQKGTRKNDGNTKDEYC